MKFTQFKEIPPLKDIQDLFMELTGIGLVVGGSWRTWRPVDPYRLLEFEPYIRKCHQKILAETVDGIQPNPCSFLRQLVRPYGFLIDFNIDTQLYTVKAVVEKKKEPITSLTYRDGTVSVKFGV